MQSTSNYDVIVVGLGCFGLAAVYYLSCVKGLRVLGIEKNHASGAMGSGSVGYARIWRFMHSEPRYALMQAEALTMFKTIEQKTGHKIVH